MGLRTTAPALPRPASRADAPPITILIGLLGIAVTALFVATVGEAWSNASDKPVAFALFLGLTLFLQLMAVEVYGRGRISVAGIGMLATGFMFGIGAALAIAVITAMFHGVRVRLPFHKTVFNATAFAIAAGAGTATYHVLARDEWSAVEKLVPAIVAGSVFFLLNVTLIVFVMSLSEAAGIHEIWHERFRWLTGHYLAFGPLALASVEAYETVGISGVLAFLLPPALLIFSMHQYIARTKQAVEELRQANHELAARNRDLRELFEFAGGLGARTHDREALVGYAQEALARMTGTRVTIDSHEGRGIELSAGGERVGAIAIDDRDGFDPTRWERLRDAIVPQLATALESARLVERVKQTHLDTIAALSKSMEAKDYYTGGHTERVSEVAVALARRLGYSGSDLEAIEIGALLHDIGKIGIPERILHKPGPLDPEEWKVMKDHPVISDYILSEVELHPIVRQIARSSHERIDGTGYPDGLAGGDIPLPARIVLVADAFDAITSDRPYRSGRHVDAALAELRANADTQFCAIVVAALGELYHEEPHILGASELREVKVA